MEEVGGDDGGPNPLYDTMTNFTHISPASVLVINHTFPARCFLYITSHHRYYYYYSRTIIEIPGVDGGGGSLAGCPLKSSIKESFIVQPRNISRAINTCHATDHYVERACDSYKYVVVGSNRPFALTT